MEAWQAKIKELRGWADEQVRNSVDQIRANLRSKGFGPDAGGPLVVDLALPGAAYFSVAAGGLAEVLHLVGPQYVCLDRCIGSSGGACSLFLILANVEEDSAASTQHRGTRCPSSRLLLESYWKYGHSEGTYTISRSFNAMRQAVGGVSSFWQHEYGRILSDSAAFKRIQEKAFVAVAGKPLRAAMGAGGRVPEKTASNEAPRAQRAVTAPAKVPVFAAATDNYVMHDFPNVPQAVQAFVATGEATLLGFTAGIDILGAGPATQARSAAEDAFAYEHGEGETSPIRLPRSFCDGGKPVAFQNLDEPASRNALLYYYTWFDSMSDGALCTPESIERLFRRGVTRTIECLLSSEFVADGSGEAGAGDRSVKSSCGAPSPKGATDKMVVVLPQEDLRDKLSTIGREKDFVGERCGGAFLSLRQRRVREISYSESAPRPNSFPS